MSGFHVSAELLADLIAIHGEEEGKKQFVNLVNVIAEEYVKDADKDLQLVFEKRKQKTKEIMNKDV